MPKKKKPFSKDTKLAELLTDDRRLLQLLPRFGIGLGFGDRNVNQVCQMNHADPELFLMVCEIYSDSSFRPSHSHTLSTICNASLMPAGKNMALCLAISTTNTNRK